MRYIPIWRDVPQRKDRPKQILPRAKLVVNLSQPLRIIIRYNQPNLKWSETDVPQWYMEVGVGYHKSYTNDFSISLLDYVWISKWAGWVARLAYTSYNNVKSFPIRSNVHAFTTLWGASHIAFPPCVSRRVIETW